MNIPPLIAARHQISRKKFPCGFTQAVTSDLNGQNWWRFGLLNQAKLRDQQLADAEANIFKLNISQLERQKLE